MCQMYRERERERKKEREREREREEHNVRWIHIYVSDIGMCQT